MSTESAPIEISGEDLFRLRKEYGLTQRQLGSQLNPVISDSLIYRYERGHRPIPPDRVVQFLEVLAPERLRQ